MSTGIYQCSAIITRLRSLCILHNVKRFQQKYIYFAISKITSAHFIIYRMGCKLKYVFYPGNIEYPYTGRSCFMQGLHS